MKSRNNYRELRGLPRRFERWESIDTDASNREISCRALNDDNLPNHLDKTYLLRDFVVANANAIQERLRYEVEEEEEA